MRALNTILPAAAVSVALAGAVPALAASAPSNLSVSPGAQKGCGSSPSRTYVIRVNTGTPCAFGRSTYAAFAAAVQATNSPLNNRLGQEAGAAFNFTLKVGRRLLDCRANGLAHDEFDIYCNDLNRYGDHVVDLVNATEPPD